MINNQVKKLEGGEDGNPILAGHEEIKRETDTELETERDIETDRDRRNFQMLYGKIFPTLNFFTFKLNSNRIF